MSNAFTHFLYISNCVVSKTHIQTAARRFSVKCIKLEIYGVLNSYFSIMCHWFSQFQVNIAETVNKIDFAFGSNESTSTNEHNKWHQINIYENVLIHKNTITTRIRLFANTTNSITSTILIQDYFSLADKKVELELTRNFRIASFRYMDFAVEDLKIPQLIENGIISIFQTTFSELYVCFGWIPFTSIF